MLSKELKEAYRAEIAKAWSDPKMVNYCVNEAAEIAVLPGGGLVAIEKQKIITAFCYGESGFDYDEAQAEAAHARSSETHLYNANMKEYRELYKELRAAAELPTAEWWLIITDTKYYNQAADCKLKGYTFMRPCDVIEMFGGSVRIDELPGQQLPENWRQIVGHVATTTEINALMEAVERAAKQHGKKVEAYIKRYGTSKVHAWTYWRDA